MNVAAIRCKNCGDLIYSRARHDFCWCSCGTVAIDGGNSGGNSDAISVTGERKYIDGPFEFKIDTSSRGLYQDWNCETDKYGRILGEDTPRRRKAIAKRKLLE